MQGSRVTIEVDDQPVFAFTESQVTSTGGDFPGNKADPQFAAKETELDQLKYGCAYTGKHDHGQLPEQKPNTPHEETLRFLEQARKVVGDELNTMTKATKAAQ